MDSTLFTMKISVARTDMDFQFGFCFCRVEGRRKSPDWFRMTAGLIENHRMQVVRCPSGIVKV